MAHFHSPRIITDGLVLALDAANVKSFRGEPTVNLVPSPTNLSTGWTNATSNATVNQQTLSDGTGIVTYTRNSESSGFAQRNCILGVTADGVTPYTITVTYEVLAKTGNPNFEMAVRRFNTPFTRYVILSMSTELGRHTVTATAIPPDGEPLGIITNLTTANTSITVRFIEVQVEQNPYATPFVNGTRGTTVATGGGWADRSGNGNHGELVNGPIFNSDNLGSLVFDGVDDRIDISNIGQQLNQFGLTKTIWVNQNTIYTSNNFGDTVSISQLGTNDIGTGPTLYFQLRSSTVAFRWQRGVNDVVATPSTTQEQNVWNMYTGILTDSNIFLYKNGTLIGQTSHSKTFLNWSNNTFRIAANAINNFLDGNISQTKIYNRALTASEVLQNYNATKGRFGL